MNQISRSFCVASNETEHLDELDDCIYHFRGLWGDERVGFCVDGTRQADCDAQFAPSQGDAADSGAAATSIGRIGRMARQLCGTENVAA